MPWLAAERRAQLLRRARCAERRACGRTAALLMFLVALTVQANVAGTGPHLPTLQVSLGLYPASLALLPIRLYRELARPPGLRGPPQR